MVTNAGLVKAGRAVQEGIEERLLMINGNDSLDPAGDWLLDLCVVNYGSEFFRHYLVLSTLRDSLSSHRGEFAYVNWNRRESQEAIFIVPKGQDTPIMRPGTINWDNVTEEIYINNNNGATMTISAEHDMCSPGGLYFFDEPGEILLVRRDMKNLSELSLGKFSTRNPRDYLRLPGVSDWRTNLIIGTDEVLEHLGPNRFLLRDYQPGMDPLKYIQSQKRT